MQQIERLNAMGEAAGKPAARPASGRASADTVQVVGVKYPDRNGGGKVYSYVGSGNLRDGQKIPDAPVTHHKSGKNYTTHAQIVETHGVVGAQVGDKLGVTGGKVHAIPTGLKYLPGTKEQQRNDEINIRGDKMRVSDYMAKFKDATMRRLNLMGDAVKGADRT